MNKNFVKKLVLLGSLLLTLVIILSACGKKDDQTKIYTKEADVTTQNIVSNSVNTNENTVENTTNTQTNNIKEENIKKDLLKDPNKKIVYAYVDDAKEWTYVIENNGQEATESYSFKIPQINIDSSDADKINKAIQDEYVKVYNHAKESFNKFGSPGGCYRIEYAYHINGDVVSIVMASFWDGGSVRRSAYNINTKTGKEVTNSELLKQKGILESEFPNKLSAALAEKTKVSYAGYEDVVDPEIIETTNAQQKRTIALENCSTSNYMYLNANNELCVIVRRYLVAGPDSTQIIFNMNTNSVYAD